MLDDPRLVLPCFTRLQEQHSIMGWNHQIRDLKAFCNTDIDPHSWSWQIYDDKFTPIITDIAAGPPELLKIVHCVSKEQCRESSSHRKAGLLWAPSYKDCHGIMCSNVSNNPEFEMNMWDVSLLLWKWYFYCILHFDILFINLL